MAVVTSAFSKSSVFAVHTNTLHDTAFSNLSTLESVFKKVPFSDTENAVSVWTEPIQIKKVAFSNYPLWRDFQKVPFSDTENAILSHVLLGSTVSTETGLG